MTATSVRGVLDEFDARMDGDAKTAEKLAALCPNEDRGIERTTDCPRCGGTIRYGREKSKGKLRAVCVTTPWCFEIIE
jgi:hypothetical protein